MLRDLAGDVIASLVGDAFLEWLLPDRWKVPSAPPEGEWNASLGSLAAFLAAIAALFCGISTMGLLRGVIGAFDAAPAVYVPEGVDWGFLGGSIVVAALSGVLAHRALEVTSRRRALARFALWLSRATILAGVLTALLRFLARAA